MTNFIRGLLSEAHRAGCRADREEGKQTESARHISPGAAFYPGNVAQLLQPVYLCVSDEIFPKEVSISLGGTFFFYLKKPPKSSNRF